MPLTLGGRRAVQPSKLQCILSIEDLPRQLPTGELLPNTANPQEEHSHTNPSKGPLWRTELQPVPPQHSHLSWCRQRLTPLLAMRAGHEHSLTGHLFNL